MRYIFNVFFCLLPISLICQTTSDSTLLKKPRFDLSFLIGTCHLRGGGPTAGEIKNFISFSSVSSLMPIDTISYSQTLDYQVDFLSLRYETYLNRKSDLWHGVRPSLLVGASYVFLYTVLRNTYEESRFRYDTLTSSQGGPSLFIDSVYSKFGQIEYYSNQVRLELALLMRSDPKFQFSFYFGNEKTR